MRGLDEFLAASWAEVIRERPTQNIPEWSAENIVFDSKMGNITGPWRPDLTPYVRFPGEAITNDFRNVPEEDWFIRGLLEKGQRVDEMFMVKSSQSGVTQLVINACVYIPQFDPGRLLYSLPSKDGAKRVVKTRLIPHLKRHCGDVIPDENDVNLTFIEMRDMIMEFGGSFSAALFSEKPLRYGFADDVEYMVAEGGVPGMLDGVHVINHFRSRFTTSDNSLLFVFSKPNLESSEFITEWKGGSQHSFFVPCPHCGKRQVLEPEGLYWDHKQCKDLAGRYDLEAVEALTTYRCACCKDHIEEAKHKYAMNNAGIYLPKAKDLRRKDEDPALVPRRLSLRINDLNSPFPKVKWGKLATMLIEAQNNPQKLRHVMTNHFARPWREKAINLKADQVRALCAGAIDEKSGKRIDERCAPYKRGEIPFIPAMLVLTVDRQGDKKKWILAAFKSDGTCAIVDYGATLSDKDILEMLDDPKDHKGGRIICLADPERRFIIDHGLCDSGYEHTVVYDMCIESGWRLYPSKGVGALTGGGAGRLCEGKEDFYEGEPILVYHYNDYQLKVHFYKGKVQKRSEARLYLPDDVGDDFVIEWISESLGPKKISTGYTVMEWTHDKKIGPNDWGDAGKMLYVIWQIMGPELQRQVAEAVARESRPVVIQDGTKVTVSALQAAIAKARTRHPVS